MRFSLLISVFFIILYLPLKAQKDDIKFKHLSVEHGLSQSSVQCIFQDSRGFMWFGTRDGLNKYDGYKFTVYRNDIHDPNSLGNSFVNKIFEDKNKNLWIGTLEGIERFDREKNSFVHFGKAVNALNVADIIQDVSGSMWVATIEDGLCLFNPENGSFVSYKHEDNNLSTIAHNEVRKIIEYDNDNLLLATRRGMDLFNKKTKKFTHIKERRKDVGDIKSNRVREIYKDSKGNIWLSMHKTGIALFNLDKKDTSFTYFDYNPQNSNCIPEKFIVSFGEDNKGNIWMGTQDKGVCIFDYHSNTFSTYEYNPLYSLSISYNFIRVIYRDNVGNMWLGTDMAGVNLVTNGGNKFMHYTFIPDQKDGLSDKYISSILEDDKGRVWLGTKAGLNLFDKKKKTFTSYRPDSTKNSIGSLNVYSIADLDNNKLALGFSTGEGLDFFDLETGIFTHYLPEKTVDDSTTIAGRAVSCIAKDYEGNIWIGTLGTALNFYDAQKKIFRKYRNSKSDSASISSNIIFVVLEDRAHTIWVGTENGLNQFDPKKKKFIRYFHDREKKNSISNNIIHSLYEDKKGRLWIGTEGGLNLFDRKSKKFIAYNEAHGLPNRLIKGIQEDKDGNLWLSTNKGLAKFNPETVICRNYDVADGLQGDEFSRGACFTNSLGEMYFGGPQGLNAFHPDSIKNNPNIPPIVFTDLQIFNKSVNANQKDSPLEKDINESKKITLAYWQSVFTLEYSALNFINTEKNQYAYMLVGFDKGWNYVRQKRSATYTNLDPGRYTFKVRASNNDGVWNERGIALEIVITPPFWKTWWFRLITIIIIIGSFITWYRIRINAVEHQKKLLEQQVKERTAEISLQKEELESQAESLQMANSELTTQKVEIEKQGKKIEGLYEEVKDSIRSAQLIQQSILPSEDLIKEYLPESFILYKPKDVVSGDFYWFDVIKDQIILAAVDCTGHGVSGALMAINGHHLLNQSIYSYKEMIASDILNRLNEGLIKELHHNDKNHRIYDGMDIALCIIDKEKMKLQYAGANNPLYILRDKELIQVKANKYAIGLTINGTINKFTNHEINLQKGDLIYVFSDGYADQLGGASGGEKFMYTRFRELLLEIRKESASQQLVIMEERLVKWMGEFEQLDDVLVMGFRI